MKAAGLTRNVDSALPCDMSNEIKDRYSIEIRNYYVMDYRDNSFGKPTHILEEYEKHLQETRDMSILSYIRQLEFLSQRLIKAAKQLPEDQRPSSLDIYGEFFEKLEEQD